MSLPRLARTPPQPRGGAVVLQGMVEVPEGARVAGAPAPLRSLGRGSRGYQAVAPVGPLRLGRHAVEHPERGSLGWVEVEPGAAYEDPEAGTEAAPRVAICMATYDPDPTLLARQVASIQEQDLEDWVCLVQDDGSPPEARDRIRAILEEDPRFLLEANPRNLGFYLNFERALSRVPAGTQVVALSDQDDLWYPSKLRELAAAIEGGAALAYSDCRVVDAAGDLLAETFWTRKANQWWDFERLVLENTVTGAAAAFRRDLLEWALPFPRLEGAKLYHDHWLALVAMSQGELAYLDKPLYEYVQHPGADTGHFDQGRRAAPEGRGERVLRERTRLALLLETLRYRGALTAGLARRAERMLAADGTALTQAVWLAGKGLRGGGWKGLGWSTWARRVLGR